MTPHIFSDQVVLDLGEDEVIEVKYRVSRYGYHIDLPDLPAFVGHDGFERRVTSHLKGIPKGWLGRWAAKRTAEDVVANFDELIAKRDTKTDQELIDEIKAYPFVYRDERADRGSAVHAAVESVITGAPLPDGLDEDQLDCAIAVEQFLKESDYRPLGTEVTVFNLEYEYAGTLDFWWQSDDGHYGILDWKTSAGIYPDFTIQLSAYRNADWALIDRIPIPGQSDAWTAKLIKWHPEYAESMSVVHVEPGVCTEYPIHYGERLWQVFRGAKFLNEFVKDTDSYRGQPKLQVYGDPVRYEVEK